MPSHISTTTATATPSPVPSGAWETFSDALTTLAPELSGRTDLLVTCAPGAGGGAPGRYLPELGVIELDGQHLAVPPETADPTHPGDRTRYPTTWGVFTHENAHAVHSDWVDHAPAGIAGTAVAEAAMLLEESRIEAAHLRRRPTDRTWLRAAVRDLILADTAADTPDGPRMTRWDAARTAALLLARVDAGVLDATETTTLVPLLTRVLGVRRLRTLTRIWRTAQATADTDTAGMLALGHRWCRAVGLEPEKPVPTRPTRRRGHRSKLSTAITDTLDNIAASTAADLAADTASGKPSSGPDPTGVPTPSPAESRRAAERAAARAAETSVREAAHRTARRVFNPSTIGTGSSPISGTRPAAPAEQAAARRLARALRAAGARERVPVTASSPTPPGRLRMREALAADAQRAAGAIPTAKPFTTTVHRHVPTPPLRVGIACDISGSMYELAAPIASAAWILARAAGHIPDARAATVAFGNQVHAITHPGHRPTRITEFRAEDGTETFTDAVDALDAALDLTRPYAARLLVVVSDGYFSSTELKTGQQRITRLHHTGCGVVWLGLGEHTEPMNHTHPIQLTTPAEAITQIAHAAIHALTTT